MDWMGQSQGSLGFEGRGLYGKELFSGVGSGISAVFWDFRISGLGEEVSFEAGEGVFC